MNDNRMTPESKAARGREALDALKADDRLLLTAADIAPVLGVDPQSIRLQVAADASALGFPCIRVGGRTMFPRVSFIRTITGE